MQLEDFLDVDKFTAEISEDNEDISSAMRKQTQRAAYYGMLHIKAKKQAAKVALVVNTLEAQLNKEKRAALIAAADELAEAESTKPEKITVDMVKAEVALDAKMRKIAMLKLDADEIEGVCRVAYEAFKTRRDMLTGQGLLAREQMRTGQQITQAREAVQGNYSQRRATRQAAARADAAGGAEPE